MIDKIFFKKPTNHQPVIKIRRTISTIAGILFFLANNTQTIASQVIENEKHTKRISQTTLHHFKQYEEQDIGKNQNVVHTKVLKSLDPLSFIKFYIMKRDDGNDREKGGSLIRYKYGDPSYIQSMGSVIYSYLDSSFVTSLLENESLLRSQALQTGGLREVYLNVPLQNVLIENERWVNFKFKDVKFSNVFFRNNIFGDLTLRCQSSFENCQFENCSWENNHFIQVNFFGTHVPFTSPTQEESFLNTLMSSMDVNNFEPLNILGGMVSLTRKDRENIKDTHIKGEVYEKKVGSVKISFHDLKYPYGVSSFLDPQGRVDSSNTFIGCTFNNLLLNDFQCFFLQKAFKTLYKLCARSNDLEFDYNSQRLVLAAAVELMPEEFLQTPFQTSDDSICISYGLSFRNKLNRGTFFERNSRRKTPSSFTKNEKKKIKGLKDFIFKFSPIADYIKYDFKGFSIDIDNSFWNFIDFKEKINTSKKRGLDTTPKSPIPLGFAGKDKSTSVLDMILCAVSKEEIQRIFLRKIQLKKYFSKLMDYFNLDIKSLSIEHASLSNLRFSRNLKFKNLEELSLEGNQISSIDVVSPFWSLENFPKLKVLNLFENPMGKKTYERLKKKSKRCYVYSNWNRPVYSSPREETTSELSDQFDKDMDETGNPLEIRLSIRKDDEIKNIIDGNVYWTWRAHYRFIVNKEDLLNKKW